MPAVRHLRPVRPGDPPAERARPDAAPDPSVPRSHPAWRPPAWWGLLEEHREHVAASARRIPWEHHPIRTAVRLEFRAP